MFTASDEIRGDQGCERSWCGCRRGCGTGRCWMRGWPSYRWRMRFFGMRGSGAMLRSRRRGRTRAVSRCSCVGVRTGRDWQAGVGQLGLFMTWLRHAGPDVSGVEARAGAVVMVGPGTSPARDAIVARTLGLPPELQFAGVLTWQAVAEVTEELR